MSFCAHDMRERLGKGAMGRRKNTSTQKPHPQTERQTDGQTGRQMDRLIDKHVDK